MITLPQCNLSASQLGFFFFNDTATTEIYPLSLHDALPIFLRARSRARSSSRRDRAPPRAPRADRRRADRARDRSEEPRLNSSHANISYAVFCLKKKKRQRIDTNSYAHCQLRV